MARAFVLVLVLGFLVAFDRGCTVHGLSNVGDVYAAIFSTPAIASDGTVVVGLMDAFVVKLSSTGAFQWSFDNGVVSIDNCVTDVVPGYRILCGLLR